MNLLPIHNSEFIHLAVEWLGKPENDRWLDFGNGVQRLTPQTLKIMIQRDIHILRLFTSEQEDVPIGVVGLSQVNRRFKTALIWIVLGDKKYSGRGYPTRAASKMLTLGFKEEGLNAIHAWTVENNYPVLRMFRRLHFHFMGRQRQCHVLDGCCYDRLWFDILSSEHKEE